MEHTKIIDKFGGIRPMATALGHKYPSTVQAWAENKKIPRWRYHEVVKAAKTRRLKITEADLTSGAPK